MVTVIDSMRTVGALVNLLVLNDIVPYLPLFFFVVHKGPVNHLICIYFSIFS